MESFLRMMQTAARARGGTLIRRCLCKDTTPIPGVKSMRQLEDNLGALGWRLSAAEVAALDEASDKVGKSTSQNIFQTA